MLVIIYLLIVPVLVAVWFIVAMAWVARGEPDVNGDTERDAGEQR